MTAEEVILEIIRILRIDGELMTDGECLDAVSGVIDENGYGPVFPSVRNNA